MKFVEVGGARISAVGLGTWQFGSTEWGYGGDYARRDAIEIVHRALDLGINLIDTAEIYALGQSERIVGEAIRGRRLEAFVATKLFPVGLPFQAESRVRSSLRRLGIERADVYQQHWPSPLFPPGALMPRLRRLVEKGLITHVGVSNHSLPQWQAAEKAFGGAILSNQVQFSLVAPGPERELVPFAQRTGRIVIAYSPLAQGLLSGRYQAKAPSNFRRFRPAFRASARARLEPLLATLKEVADHHGATTAQVALAWLIRKPNVVVIPGASSVRQLEQNIAAADLDLTDEEDARLSGAR